MQPSIEPSLGTRQAAHPTPGVLYSQVMFGTLIEEATEERTELASRWHVVLLDDDDHTYEYVIEMLEAVFGHPTATAFRMATEVDRTGRVIVWTGAREVAEFKQERVHTHGSDERITDCQGSMSAMIEPAD